MLITLDHLVANEFAAVKTGSGSGLPHPLGVHFKPEEADPVVLSNQLTVVMRRGARMEYSFRRLFMKIIQSGHFDVLRQAVYDDIEITDLHEFFISVVAAVKLPEEVQADALQRKRKREGTTEVKAEVKKVKKEDPPKKEPKPEPADPSETDQSTGSDFDAAFDGNVSDIDSDFDANVELVKNLRPSWVLRPKSTHKPLSDAEFELLMLGPNPNLKL